MRTPVIALIVAVWSLGQSGAAHAHFGPTYYAQEVNPGTITIDGMGYDPGWNAPLWDPGNTIDKKWLGEYLAGGRMPTDNDWDGFLKVGWSRPPDNMLYFYSQVRDDLLNDDASRNGEARQDDALGVLVDADHGWGDYLAIEPQGTITQEFLIRMSEADMAPGPSQDDGNTRSFIFGSPERAWMSGPPWMVVEVTKPVGRSGVLYAYEGKMALWDRAGNSPEASIRHVNAVGQEIGLSFCWSDADAIPDRRDDQPGTQGPGAAEAWGDAGTYNNFVLLWTGGCDLDGPSAAETTTWGAIKATFRHGD